MERGRPPLRPTSRWHTGRRRAGRARSRPPRLPRGAVPHLVRRQPPLVLPHAVPPSPPSPWSFRNRARPPHRLVRLFGEAPSVVSRAAAPEPSVSSGRLAVGASVGSCDREPESAALACL